MYDYVRRAYGVDPIPGQRFRTKKEDFSRIAEGVIQPENPRFGHYVMIAFDKPGGGVGPAAPAHPTSIEYLGEPRL